VRGEVKNDYEQVFLRVRFVGFYRAQNHEIRLPYVYALKVAQAH